jgi:ADP-ribose pyrophosphatase YjhB (NUDIX family)
VKIYVASSWRNLHQPAIVDVLRSAGHEVYDFKRPVPGDEDFHWSEIDGGWKNWTVAEYAKALEHPIAARGFASDMRALDDTDLVVLVLPSGRSASWEYGYWCGKTGKQGIVHCPEKAEPELMYRGSFFTWTTEGLLSTVARWEKQKGGPTAWELSIDSFVEELNALQPTPNLPFDVWKAIGRLVVQPAVELVIENECGGVLLTYRKDQYWDAWHIPGGFMAPGESIAETCSRVAKRELGIDVDFRKVIDVCSWPEHPPHPYASLISIFAKCVLAGEEPPHDGTFYGSSDYGSSDWPQKILPAHESFLRRQWGLD